MSKDCEHWYQAELIWQETQNPRVTTAKKDEIKQGLRGEKLKLWLPGKRNKYFHLDYRSIIWGTYPLKSNLLLTF